MSRTVFNHLLISSRWSTKLTVMLRPSGGGTHSVSTRIGTKSSGKIEPTNTFLDACTSGLALILSQFSPDLRNDFDRSVIQENWLYCETVLDHLSGHSISVKRSLELLRRLHDRILPTMISMYTCPSPCPVPALIVSREGSRVRERRPRRECGQYISPT